MQSQDKIPSLESLFIDLEHPNPNINNKAFLDMHRFWPDESLVVLLNYLDCEDIEIRRRSVKALSYFGEEIVDKILKLYLDSDNQNLKISCLKVLVLLASKHDLNKYRNDLNDLIESAITDESAEIILATISLLRQMGKNSLTRLKELCRNENVLKAKAALTAVLGIPDNETQLFLQTIVDDTNLEKLIRDSARDALSL